MQEEVSGSDEFGNALNEKISLCGIAHYNLASQAEFLDDFSACIKHYELAIHLVKKLPSTGQSLVKQFSKSLKHAKTR